MSLVDFPLFKNLAVRFGWKNIGGAVDASRHRVKQRADNKSINLSAGRDLFFNQNSPGIAEVPFAYFEAGISSRIDMALVTCRVHNLSSVPIFVESLAILGRSYPMGDKLVRPNSSTGVPQINNLSWQDDASPIFLDMVFKDTQGRRYCTRHSTELIHMATGKFKIQQILKPASVELVGE